MNVAGMLDMGYLEAGRETNAGKIGYKQFTTDSLDIIGAGESSGNRKVRIFDNLETGTINCQIINGFWPSSGAPASFVHRRDFRTLGGQSQTYAAQDCLPGTILRRTSIFGGCTDRIPSRSSILSAFGSSSPPVGYGWEITVFLVPDGAAAIWYLEPSDSSVKVYPSWTDNGGTARFPSVRGYSCVAINFYVSSSSQLEVFVQGQSGALGVPDQ